MVRQQNVPLSVRILRQHGSLDLRTLAMVTAERGGFGRVMYEDVNAVLEAAERRGEVRMKIADDDYRCCVWEAVGT